MTVQGREYGAVECDFSRRGPVRRDIISLLRDISPAFRQLADHRGVRALAWLVFQTVSAQIVGLAEK